MNRVSTNDTIKNRPLINERPIFVIFAAEYEEWSVYHTAMSLNAVGSGPRLESPFFGQWRLL